MASVTTYAATGLDDLGVRGFVSLGFDRSDQQAEYGAEIDDSLGFSDDSIVGLQLEYQISSRLEAVTQIVARGTEDWDLEAEWAFLSYSATDNLVLRGGRLRSPLYMMSDYLEVGSSYPWVRPPMEVYDLLSPFSSYDGVDLVYQQPVGDWFLTLQAAFGRIDGDTSTLDVEAENFAGLNASLEKDAWRFRLGYNHAKATLELNDADLQALNLGVLNPLGYSLETENTDVSFATAGFQYDDGSWWWLGEVTRLSLDDAYVRDREAFYLTTGYRFGDWMPYVSYAKTYSAEESERNDIVDTLGVLSQTALAGGDLSTAITLGTAAAVVDTTHVEQTTYTLGLRYDFNANITLKLEANHLTDFGDTNGLFEAFMPLDNSAKLYSFALEAVF